MKKQLLTLVLTVAAALCMAQFPVGHRQLVYQDPARANRNVSVELYYPGISAGDDVDVQSGIFPIIVFGHGFLMGYDAYAYWKDQLVPEGYIMAFPTTESGSPDHAAFGADLAFLINTLKAEGSNAASFLYQHTASTSAVMGHSMGGGASFLACENNGIPDCMITLAAANTNPSSIAAAAHVSIPALVIAGEDDCVAPPVDHQLPMYDSLTSSCKTYISIKNGAHCYFGDYNFTCTLGESTCNPVPSINRADQLATSLIFVKWFLNYELKNSGNWSDFETLLAGNSNITYNTDCTPPASINSGEIQKLQIYPNPASTEIRISLQGLKKGEYQLKLMSLPGTVVLNERVTIDNMNDEYILDIRNLKPSLYLVLLEGSDGTMYSSRCCIR
jgi:pimeloyl-ACP methyl ester carboxylesterase